MCVRVCYVYVGKKDFSHKKKNICIVFLRNDQYWLVFDIYMKDGHVGLFIGHFLQRRS